MKKMEKLLPIIIGCHKQDYYLTKLCIASIRYYYPSARIFILKDYANGHFSTAEIEKYFHVQQIHLPFEKFGWIGAQKIYLLLSDFLNGKPFLMLDSDIVFTGRVFDSLMHLVDSNSVIVSSEDIESVKCNKFRQLYYDSEWAREKYPKLSYPGYVFNSGHIVAYTGFLKKKDIQPYFNDTFPFWTNEAKDHLPLRDQSLFNILFPEYHRKRIIKLKHAIYIWWSESDYAKNKLNLDDVRQGKHKFLIHWAGAARTDILNMTRSDILLFFESVYYTQLPFGVCRCFFVQKMRVIRLKISHLIIKLKYFLLGEK